MSVYIKIPEGMKKIIVYKSRAPGRLCDYILDGSA
jgi:hypothetical protein